MSLSKAIRIVAPGSEWDGEYDLDGWRVEELPGRGHVVHLRLGRWVQIFALAAVFPEPGTWRLLLVDSPADWVDEPELLVDDVSFDCQLDLSPSEGAKVRLDGRDAKLTAVTLAVSSRPRALELGLVLADPPRALVLDRAHGWRLVDARGDVLSANPTFSIAIDTRA